MLENVSSGSPSPVRSPDLAHPVPELVAERELTVQIEHRLGPDVAPWRRRPLQPEDPPVADRHQDVVDAVPVEVVDLEGVTVPLGVRAIHVRPHEHRRGVASHPAGHGRVGREDVGVQRPIVVGRDQGRGPLGQRDRIATVRS